MLENEKLFTEFKPNTYEEWLAQVNRELKGKSINELALRSQAEDISIEPFYNQVEEKLKQQSAKLQWLLSYKADNTWEITNEFAPLTNQIISSNYHNQGANAVQELAFALAQGKELLSNLLEESQGIDTLSPAISFRMAIGNDFFLEISKFRALRLLWANIIQQYQPRQHKSYFSTLSAETSQRVYTALDEHNNLLRATTQAMSAIIGGADTLYIAPFDEKTIPSDFGKRLSINLHHILRAESKLDKVIDAGSGSWYLEKMTETVAEKAWTLFQEIENTGSFSACMQSGWIDGQIEKSNNIRNADIESGKETIVGVNKYRQKSEA